MNDDLVQEVLDRLDSVGDLTAQGFEILVRQAYIEGISRLLGGSLTLLVGLFIVLLSWRTFNEKFLPSIIEYKPRDRNYGFWRVQEFVGCWGSVAGIIVAIIGLCNVWSGVKWLINPEFYAIRFLLNSIG